MILNSQLVDTCVNILIMKLKEKILEIIEGKVVSRSLRKQTYGKLANILHFYSKLVTAVVNGSARNRADGKRKVYKNAI